MDGGESDRFDMGIGTKKESGEEDRSCRGLNNWFDGLLRVSIFALESMVDEVNAEELRPINELLLELLDPMLD